MKWLSAVLRRITEEWDRFSGRRGARQQREFESATTAFRRDLDRVFERIPSDGDGTPNATEVRELDT